MRSQDVILSTALLRREQHRVCFSVFRCFLKLGEWQLNLQGINESTIPKVLQYYSAATEHDRSWYKVTGDGSEPGSPPLPPDAGQCGPGRSRFTTEPRWPGLVGVWRWGCQGGTPFTVWDWRGGGRLKAGVPGLTVELMVMSSSERGSQEEDGVFRVVER